jgi:sugar lactone lactonase YvrE
VVATDAEFQESSRSFGITISVNAWNLSFASYNSDGKTGQFSVAAQDTLPTGLFFKPDGTQMYVSGDAGNDINEYTLSTPWDVTTSTFVRSFLVTGQEGNPRSVFFKPDGTKMYVMGESGDDINEYALSTAWNISTATYVQIFSIAAQEITPRGLYITDDGTKMYIVGQTSDAVHEYSLSTAWNISTATYVRGFSVAAQEGQSSGLFFKPDGTKMYIIGPASDSINEYTLTVPWNVNSAFYVTSTPINQLGLFTDAPVSLFFKPDGTECYTINQALTKVVTFVMSTPWSVATTRIKIPTKYFSVVAQDTDPGGVFFKPDGSRMYISGDSGNDINEYMLSTPWDIDTADHNFIQTFLVAAQNTKVTDLFFKPDGTRMYVVGAGAVNEYTLSVAWSIVSAVYSATFNVNASNTYAETATETVFFKSDGTEMYILGGAIDTVATFILSTPWSIATAKIKTPTKYLSVASENTDTTGFFFKPDGTKLYTVGSAADEVNEYNLSTPWSIFTATFVQVFSVAAQDTDPQDVHFSPDGTRMYILGYTGDDVNEYSLSTAWNIATATYVRAFSVSAQETGPLGLFFKPDGTRMYVTGFAGDAVNEYSLSTAWNISTATYVRVFSIAAQEINPYGLFFKSDGTRMYVTGFSGDDVNEYSLSTAWDVSTTTYVQAFSVAAQTGSPEGVFFSDTGDRMYILSGTGDDIFEYDVSTPWNTSTASYNPVGNFGRFSVAAQETIPTGLFFRPNGTQMYVLGTTGDDVNEYTLSTPWDVTTATYVRVFSVAAQASSAQGIFFKPTGTSMYIVDSGNNAIYEYDIG